MTVRYHPPSPPHSLAARRPADPPSAGRNLLDVVFLDVVFPRTADDVESCPPPMGATPRPVDRPRGRVAVLAGLIGRVVARCGHRAAADQTARRGECGWLP